MKAKPDAKVTNPLTAVTHSLNALGLKSIALVSPYVDALNQDMKIYFESIGIQVKAIGSFNQEDDKIVGKISPMSIEKVVLELGKNPEVDGVFVTCTNMRIAEKINDLEKILGKPVTSSNHSMAWHALKIAGAVNSAEKSWGKLFN